MAENKYMRMDVWEFNQSMHKIVANHVKLLLEQYKTMKGLYGSSNKTLMESVRDFWPKGTDKFFTLFDNWIENQLEMYEKSVDESVKEYVDSISELEFKTPNTNHFLVLVGEHTKLWVENYKKLQERREQTGQELLEAMKKLMPAIVHPVIDNTNRWVQEQNDRIDQEIIERIQKFNRQLERGSG